MEDLESLSIFKKIIIANWKYSPSEKEIRKMVQYAKKNNITIVGTSLWSKFTDQYKNCEDKYALYKELGIPIFIHGKIKTIDDIKYAKNSSSINGIFNLTDYII
jgi:tRNA-dihydrouridine synthase